MRNKRSFNKSNTRVVNNAITVPFTVHWAGDEIGQRKRISSGNVISEYFGKEAAHSFHGYISSISVEAADIEAVEWAGIVYQPVNTNRRYKVKGPLSRINISSNETDYLLEVLPREGTINAIISVTLVTRSYVVN
jgi:hypothetical protein